MKNAKETLSITAREREMLLEDAKREYQEALARLHIAELRLRALELHEALYIKSEGRRFSWREFLKFSESQNDDLYQLIRLIDVDRFELPERRKLGILEGRAAQLVKFQVEMRKDAVNDLLHKFCCHDFRINIAAI